MHVLMTADTVGGVWTYTRELVTQLSGRGVEVTLVSFGQIPSAEQADWIHGLKDVSFYPTAFRLEWMQDSQRDLEESAEFLRALISETKPDLLHSNQFYYGAIACHLPRLVVAHSDVVSWWVSVHGAEPPESEWIKQYRANVYRGLSGADAVVAPSRWMLEQICEHYLEPKQGSVVYNGRDPALFVPCVAKQDYAVSIGRLWDAGKQVSLLLGDDLPIDTVLIGSERSPDATGNTVLLPRPASRLKMEGFSSEAQIRQIFARASIYLATSRYEPFGLAPLEAALSRCALLVNDIPSFRELWGEDAIYFQQNNSRSLINEIQQLASNSARRAEYADRALDRARTKFTSERMADDYLKLYRNLVRAEVAAA
jgi:glycosyltransferase involved in cell wall biosynthesis